VCAQAGGEDTIADWWGVDKGCGDGPEGGVDLGEGTIGSLWEQNPNDYGKSKYQAVNVRIGNMRDHREAARQ
jgi:hypothetical protein